MAAHPFGPIENQLIVGYYKRGFSPAKVKPIFRNVRNLQLFAGRSQLERYLFQPVFYGWSPANGNSSSHDFRVSCDHSQVADFQSLLSRGLGYRITFTMPEQEIRTEDPTSWLQCEFETLDFSGRHRLNKQPIDLRTSTFRYWVNPQLSFLVRFRSVQYEVTVAYTKIVENGMLEYYFPVFRPPGSSIDERHLAAAWLHEPLLGYFGFKDQDSYPYAALDACFQYMKCVFLYICSPYTVVTSAQKAHMRTFLERSSAFVIGCFREAARQMLDPGRLADLMPRLLDNLESDIRKWLDDEGPFPRYFSTPATVIRVEMRSSRSLRNIANDVQGFFNPWPLLKLIKQGLQTQPVQIPRELDNQNICWQTKSFLLFKQGWKYYISKKGMSDSKVYCLPDAWIKRREGYTEGFCIVPNMDAMVTYKIDYNVDFTLKSVNLNVAYSLLDRGKDPTYTSASRDINVPFEYQDRIGRDLGDPIDFGDGELYNPPTLALSPAGGVIVIDYQNLPEIQVMVYWMNFKEPHEIQDWWVGHFELAEDSRCLRIEFESTHLTKRGKEVYLGTIFPLESEVDQGWLLLCCLAAESTNKRLYLRSQQYFAPDIDYYDTNEITLLFMEVKKHRVFACAFTPDCRLWAFMYWKGRFVCAGTHTGQSCKPFDLSSRFGEISPIWMIFHPAGLIGSKRIGVQNSRNEMYKFARITFRCQ